MFDFLDLFTLVCGGDVKTTAEAAVQEHGKNNDPAEATALEPVDAMNAKNYLVVHLSQPMGILLEENYDAQYGGAFVSEINEGCSAAADGSICRGDQVIAIGDKRVSGMDFDEVIKLIFDSVEMKIKLTLFRGPAESLYGPSGASKEWLDEFVAERGEEAALVEEDSESEVMPDIADVAVSPALLDDVAVDAAAAAAAAADAYEFGETVEADQVLVDSESCDETEADAALEVENEVDVDEEVECEAEVEKEVDESVGAVLIEDEVDADVQLAHETEVEKGVDTTVRAVLIEDDADSDEEVAVEAEVEDEAEAAEDVSVVGDDEEVASEAELENEGDGTNEAVLVEEEADSEEQVECEAALETDAPILDGLVSKASKEWLDSYFANPESQLVSDDEMDEADTLGESTADLETRARKAAELKEAALAAVVEKDDSTNAKGILKEPRYSPKGVEELKHLEPSPADTKKSFDDESAVSSVWSEADDYIGQVVDEVPVKRVGSSLAAMGVASTLATAMILN